MVESIQIKQKFKQMKNFVLLVLMCFSSMTLSGQQFLLKGGLNFNNVSTEKEIDISTSNGFHAGLGIETPVISLLNVGTGIYYTRRGYKSNETTMEGDVTIDYLDVPVDFMLKIKPGDVVGVLISAGPYFSYGISSSVFDIDGIRKDGYDNNEIDLKRIDAGINIGAGIEVSNFRLSTAYGVSLTDLGSIEDNKLKNRVLSISLGYLFD